VQAAVTYTGLTQALLAYIAIFGWWDLLKTIRTGDVASDLSRPSDFFWYWWAQDFGRATGHLVFRGLPLLALYALAYRIALPPTLFHGLAFLVSITLALLISFTYRFIVSLAAFWTQDAVGIGRTAYTVSVFFSGFLMPLVFFPPWAATIMSFTPFPSQINTPVEIYLGLVSGPALPGALATQLLWFIALYALARLVLSAGVKKLVIQGG
jgi:ABC-2 type transport system permease protein